MLGRAERQSRRSTLPQSTHPCVLEALTNTIAQIFTLRPEPCTSCNSLHLNNAILPLQYDESRQAYYTTTWLNATSTSGTSHGIHISYYGSNSDVVGNDAGRRFIVPNPNEWLEVWIMAVDDYVLPRAIAFHATVLIDEPLRRIHTIGMDNMAREWDVDFTKFAQTCRRKSDLWIMGIVLGVLAFVALVVMVCLKWKTARSLWSTWSAKIFLAPVQLPLEPVRPRETAT